MRGSCRGAALFACGAAAVGLVAGACTFGSAGASGSSAGETAADPSGSEGGPPPPSSSGAGNETGDAAAATSTDTSLPSGSTGQTADPTTGDPPSDGSGNGTTDTGGGDQFLLCDAADPDLRACYDFVDAESGVLHDLSSHGNDGTVSPQVTVSPGPFGSMVRVSGDAELLVPDDPSLDLLGPDMSFDAWVYLDVEPPVGARRGVFDNDGQYSLMLFGGEGLRCGFGHTNVTASVPFDQWFHVVCVASEGGTAMYLDGVEVAVGGPVVDAFPENLNPIAIGDNSPQLDQPLDGEIAALRIFSRTLSPAEITAAATAPTG